MEHWQKYHKTIILLQWNNEMSLNLCMCIQYMCVCVCCKTVQFYTFTDKILIKMRVCVYDSAPHPHITHIYIRLLFRKRC